MPFAPSDDDASVASSENAVEEVPEQPKTAKSARVSPSTKPVTVDVEEQDEGGDDLEEAEVIEEDEEDEEDEEYIVEAILAHMLDEQGELRFKVKWQGYDKKSDQTWEPEENLEEGASELLKEYFTGAGGREHMLAGGKKPSANKRGRPGTAPSASQAVSTKKRKAASISKSATPDNVTKIKEVADEKWLPPLGSWEEDVEGIDAVEKDDVTGFMVYIKWKNGKRTMHPREYANKRCPQKMLQYYEAHLSFIPASRASEASTNVIIEPSKKRRGRPSKDKTPIK